jgi:hypothetical protein
LPGWPQVGPRPHAAVAVGATDRRTSWTSKVLLVGRFRVGDLNCGRRLRVGEGPSSTMGIEYSGRAVFEISASDQISQQQLKILTKLVKIKAPGIFPRIFSGRGVRRTGARAGRFSRSAASWACR